MYNPGIQDRSGEILAGGISQFGGTLAQVIAALGQQRDQAEELRTQMGGAHAARAPLGTEENPASMDLSMFGVPEGPGEGTGEGAATPEDKAKSAAKVTKALRDLGEHGYGYDRNTLETMGLPELRGLARRSEMQAMQQERATSQKLKLAELERVMAQTKEMQDQAAEDDAVGLAMRKFAEDPSANFEQRMTSGLQELKGGKGAMKFMELMSRMGKSNSVMAPGEQVQVGDLGTLIGTGGPTPHFQPKVVKGLPLGERQVNKDGDVLIGMGETVEPKLFAAEDIKAKKTQGDTGRGRATFLQAAPELGRQLDNLESTIIANNGNTTQTTWDPATVARLGQLPFQIAENYNKVVDPHSVNRPEKLKQDMEHLLPMGPTIRKDVTLAAIRNLRSELTNRIRNFHSTEKELPPNLPESVANGLNISTKEGTATTKVSADKIYTDASGKKFKFTGANPKDLKDPANWEVIP